jgi:serine/threonine-protein kinase RsbW
VTAVVRTTDAADSRDVSLTIPARPDYLVLARLALSAVCRLTPLSPEEVADLKLAITEAANDYVDESRPLDDESRLSFSFKLGDDRLQMDLDGPVGPVAATEQELSRAIIEATVDESSFSSGRTRLVKYLKLSAK